MREVSSALVIVFLTLAAWVPNAGAYPDFGADGTNDNCQECHKLFGGGESDPDHEAHRAGVAGGCLTCHGGGFPAQLSSPTLPSATGCVGCHGRDQDAGGDDPVSDGFGRGLRQHHAWASIAVCAGCHTDTDSATSPAVGENVPPPLYAVNTFLDSCNGSEERFVSAAVSLDNDGDGLTDAADPDCPPPTTTTSSTTTTTSTSSTTTTLAAGLIPGGGTTKSDCYAELAVTGIENPSQRVENNKIVLCTEGEPCDSGPCGDNQCDVRVRLCINQHDPNLRDCTPPRGLDSVKVKTPGKVKLNVAVPALLEGSQCGTFLDGPIPVKVDKRGKVKGAGKAKLGIAAKAPKGTKPRSDQDAITIKCVPRTVACPQSRAFLPMKCSECCER